MTDRYPVIAPSYHSHPIRPFQSNAIKLRKSLVTQPLASPFGGSAEGNRGMLAV